MTEAERDAAEQQEGTTLNLDFRDDPYPDATAYITDESGNQVEKKNIKRSEAVCYFFFF